MSDIKSNASLFVRINKLTGEKSLFITSKEASGHNFQTEEDILLALAYGKDWPQARENFKAQVMKVFK